MSEKSLKKVAYITGASSGIGAAIAKEFSSRGYRVALLARREERVHELKQWIESQRGEALAIRADVTDPVSLDSATKLVLSTWGGIDIVVANAGFASSGPFTRLTVDDYRRQMETNVFGVLNTLYATKEAVTESRGTLALIGSIAGRISMPFASPYAMSKFAVRALALSVREELKRKGVKVVLIAPGFVESEIGQVDNSGRWNAQPVKQIPSKLVVPIGRAAPQIVNGILSGKREVVITRHGRLLIWLHQYLPGLYNALMMRFLSRAA